jgi:hypothetical protein
MIEPCAPLDAAEGVAKKPSADQATSDPIPDTLDTLGRLMEGEDSRPSPAAMPQRRNVGATATSELPKRQRSRTRGRHSSRPRR